MSDNPFDEESDRTVIRPVPGGGRSVRSPVADPFKPPAPQRRDAGFAPETTGAGPGPMVAGEAEPIVLGVNPLVSAAAPFLALISRLSRTYSVPNATDLRGRTLQQIRTFERDAQGAGLARELVVRARYVLCASLDDVAQNTEWGRDGEWASQPLVAGFQDGVRGYEGIQSGVQFFRLLDEAKRSPGKDLPLLELMYLCLSLGFLGELRINPRPLAALDRVRQDLYAVIAGQRQGHEDALSPHWTGEAAPYRPPRAVLPVWVIGSAVLALLGGLFVWLSFGLNAASDDVAAQMRMAPPDHLPQIVRVGPVLPPVVPASPPDQPDRADRLTGFLQPEVDRGLISIHGDGQRVIIRIRNVFASGSAAVPSRAYALLERIGQALVAERGRVDVAGYTDNKPIRSVRFPSNYQLSAARAEAVALIIARALQAPERISATGHADANPIGSDEDNRRIEVVLRRQS